MSKGNGPGTPTATAPKRKVILQEIRRVDAKTGEMAVPGGEDPPTVPLDYYEDLIVCTGVRDAHKKRREEGGQGTFRIIEILDEFEITHEPTTTEVITRGGQ